MIPSKGRLLFIIGSPRGTRSTSNSIVDRMETILSERFQIEKQYVKGNMTDSEEGDFLIKAYDTDVIIISSPLYVDCLPAPLLQLMEAVDQNVFRSLHRNTKLLAIINCGFPESRHNDVAIEICRNFAHKTGMIWCGGAGIGAGASIDGRILNPLGPEKNIVQGLDMMATSLLNDEEIKPEALELISKQMFPSMLYTTIANQMWKSRAKKAGVRTSLKFRP